MKKNIPSLDGLRAVSIVLVILAHAKKSYRMPLSASKFINDYISGDLGVTIFFVISGFLITHLLLEERRDYGLVSIKSFYIRRTLRILPVCYLYLLSMFAAAMAGLIPPASWTLFLYGFTYTMNFANIAGAGVMGHLWTLAVEEQFYLFWPWVARCRGRIVAAAIITIILAAPFFRYCSRFDLPVLNFLNPFLTHVDTLMFGCALALTRFYKPDWWNPDILGNVYLRVASVFGCWAVFFLQARQFKGFGISVLGPSIAALLIAFLIAGLMVIRKGSAYRFLNHPLTAKIGVLSYSLYIWQQFFLVDINFTLGRVWWRSFPVNIILVFFAAWVSYNFWEKRFFKLKDRFRPLGSKC